MDDRIDSLLKAPCKELKPVEPFPFKSNRISRGIRFQKFLILFPFYPEYKKCQHLYTFNLLTLKWGNVQLINSPEILENTDNYKVFSANENEFLLFGCYKGFQANTTGNLFFQSQTMTLKKTLGQISATIDHGELILEWKECYGAAKLPYRENVSFGLRGKEMCLFGGCDENGKVTNDLYTLDFEGKKAVQMELINTHLGGNENLPCARMSHGFTSDGFWMFGGEDKNSDMINDIWHFPHSSSDAGISRQTQSPCHKFNKKSTNRCPKLGTPCLWQSRFREVLLYIGKSTTQTLPPFKNYLCAETFDSIKDETMTWSQKEPLPFDGVPHTMEIFENQLIFGFESSIYSIVTENIIAPDFESLDDGPNDGVLTKKKIRPMNFKDHMRQYFEERPFPDVTFKVQGEEIRAHRGILSVRCPFFGELWGNERKGEGEKNQLIEITDLSPVGFNTLLEWLYCNEILDFKDEAAIQLLKVTNKYSLPKLKIEAEKCLMKNLTVENILDRAKLATEYNARELETAVVKFLAKEIDEVNKREELNHFPNSILYRAYKIGMIGKIGDEALSARFDVHYFLLLTTEVSVNDHPATITQLPCEEVKPIEPFPFKSNRISRGIKYKHYLILFPFYADYQKCQHLYTFNLETLEWSNVELQSSPEILENTSNYTILPYEENSFFFYGCYKTFTAARTNNLFSQMQTVVSKKSVGVINVQLDQGRLILDWEELKGHEKFPYLERFSASIDAKGGCLYIFGGSDENGNLTNRLTKFHLKTGELKEMGLYNRFDGTEENIPWARQSHGSFFWNTKLYIFGGEDKDSNMINDLWEVAAREKIDGSVACRKLDKNGMNRRPKLGTPSTNIGPVRYYIARSSSETIAPIRNYLCADHIQEGRDSVGFYTSKKNLLFDGIPHTMEVFQSYIIMGFESSIYAISLDGKPLESSLKGVEFDSYMMSLAKSRKPKSYKEHMREYFEQRPYPDVKFKVQDQEINAHKGILSVRSKYFGDLFTSEEKSSYEISDLSPSAFTMLLEYFYCNSVMNVKDQPAAVELLRLGDKYTIGKLREGIEKLLVKKLTIENILERAKLAVELNSKNLEDAAVSFAVQKIDELEKREELNQFPSRILLRINQAKK